MTYDGVGGRRDLSLFDQSNQPSGKKMIPIDICRCFLFGDKCSANPLPNSTGGHLYGTCWWW